MLCVVRVVRVVWLVGVYRLLFIVRWLLPFLFFCVWYVGVLICVFLSVVC